MTDNKSKTPFYLIDTSADFYRPFGVRLAICLSVTCWAALEIHNGDGFWAVISGAAALYCVYVLFLTYHAPAPAAPVIRPDDPEEDDEAPTEAEKTDDKPHTKDQS